MKKLRKPPSIANPEAVALVEEAADSIGMSLEELTNLVVDGGLTTLPSSDGIIKKYSLEDLGKRLWGELQVKPKHRRPEWFQELLQPQQIAIIVLLRHRDYPTEVIAREFGVTNLKVARIWNKYADDLGAQVVGLRLNTIAGQMQLTKEKAQKMAHDKGDAKALWAIEKDSIAILQSLGIMDHAAKKIEHTVKFDDQKIEEIEAIAALRAKQVARKEEIKQIEANVIDERPEIDEDYD